MTASFQTRSFLIRRFEEAGIHPRTGYGQNFLIDGNLLKLLAGTAELDEDDVVLEVGTGTGSLTALVAPHVAHVVTVELDARLFQLASEELAYLKNVTMLHVDALAGKNKLNPALLEEVHKHLARDEFRRFKLVSNLPFNVATPVISNLLACDTPPATMTVTIQKELAERLAAAPCTKDYSALSAWVQCQCQVRIVRTMPPDVFWPRPKVSSAIVHLALDADRRKALAESPGGLAYFHEFVRAIFLHRRKFLRSAIVSSLKNLTKAQVDAALAEQGLCANARAEELDWQKLHALAVALRSAETSSSA
ncbi:MAG: ribosomal RNA small subunit methyltransferase A [Planctomycetia bacterium]|nr:ribosomal RNA small subunit methyltransferase A [Planctomycetia bacterium]